MSQLNIGEPAERVLTDSPFVESCVLLAAIFALVWLVENNAVCIHHLVVVQHELGGVEDAGPIDVYLFKKKEQIGASARLYCEWIARRRWWCPSDSGAREC